MLAVMGTCCISLLAACGALLVYLTIAQRRSFAEDSAALVEVLAANSAGTVAFGDREVATELLIALRANQRVAGALILQKDGEVFATVGTTNLLLDPSLPAVGSMWYPKNHLVQSSPIILRGERIGLLRIDADFAPTLSGFLQTYSFVFACTFVGVVGVGWLVAFRARQVIADPIRSLADSVREISAGENYTRRAETQFGGEMEEIADAFNTVADRARMSAELANEVTERRRIEGQLRESEERFRSLFENAPIGLYRSSHEGNFLMANQALLAMLGCKTFEELVQSYETIHVGVLPDYREHFRNCLERIGMVEETEVQWRRCDGKIITVRESAKVIRDKAGRVLCFEGCVEDITARKEAAEELQRLNRELVDASRLAGMAEVATGVLHNVGNVLNSVSVSAQLLHEQVGRSKFASLRQAVELLGRNTGQLGSYLENDPKGRLLPGFLVKVTEHVTAEQQRWVAELQQMQTYIEHMKEIVAVQQDYARVSHVVEPLSPVELVEDALRMNGPELLRHNIAIQRDFSPVPLVLADKHKVLQILINLIRNAKYAMSERSEAGRWLKLRIYKNGTGRVKIQVQDNGSGIAPENLTRIFQHGFTTKPDGHGFGLHSGALAAQQLGGALVAESDGSGKGATFTLELPPVGGQN
jgi:PAS domain S-box-containing protein